MKPHLIYLRALSTIAVLLAAFAVYAQPQTAPKDGYQPQPYQDGKDVIWLPTPQIVVDKMLELANVTSRDFVIDLGSGDGRTVIAAAKRHGARALGIEYNPDLVEYSTRAARAAGVADKVKFVKADIFETDFSQATVITMYLLTTLNMKLRPTILDLKPGTRIVSHAFDMGDWKADRSEIVDNKNAYFWIVPAKVAGDWQIAGGELSLQQTYQMVEGTLRLGDKTLAVTNGRLRGDQISFTAGGVPYSGRVRGDRIEGKSGSSGTWSATRRGAHPVSSRS